MDVGEFSFVTPLTTACFLLADPDERVGAGANDPVPNGSRLYKNIKWR